MEKEPPATRLAKIDRRLLELIAERSQLQIDELTQRQDPDSLFTDQDRLRQLVASCHNGPLPEATMVRVLNELFFAAVNTARPVSIAFLGPEGSFSSIALTSIFGESVGREPQRTIAGVFRAVEMKKATFGVVPVENSTEGAVTFTLDELIDTDLAIIAEKPVRITFALLSQAPNLASVQRVYTHPQPLGQCKEWCHSNLNHADIVTVDSTTTAAQQAAEDPDSAAIASELAAELYQLPIVASGIEDARLNFTRFFVIGRGSSPRTGHDKTSIVCAVKDRPAALLRLLQPFADAGINMVKIESRPDKKRLWEYNFFIDLCGHQDDDTVRQALEKMREETVFLKILGSYPMAR